MLGRVGNKLDRAVTLRDLVDSGFAKLRDGYLQNGGSSPISGPGTGIGSAPSLTPPPTPSGFAVTGAISNLIIECDPATYLQGHGHGASVLYGTTVAAGDPLPTFADAVELMAAPGTVFAYATDPSTTWRLWLKWRSRDGVLSVDPAGGIKGIEGKTGVNVAKLVQAMTGPGNPFKVVTEPITLPDGSVVGEGTYTSDAYIHNGFVVNAMIANLAVDNAKVANLSAAKLTAGSIAVGQYIQSTDYVSGLSGWRINGGGTLEANNGVFRGGVFASYGSFAGSLSAATGTFAGELTAAYGTFRGYVAGGSFSGSAWPAAGGTGFYLGADVFRIGNYNDGNFFEVYANGNVLAPGLSISGGSATFSGVLSAVTGSFNGVVTGSLSAATGTFAGTLTAAAVNAVDTVNIAGNAVSAALSASGSTGTLSTSFTVPSGQTWQSINTVSWDMVAASGSSSFETIYSLTGADNATVPSSSMADTGEASSPTYRGAPVTRASMLTHTAGSHTITATAIAPHTSSISGVLTTLVRKR